MNKYIVGAAIAVIVIGAAACQNAANSNSNNANKPATNTNVAVNTANTSANSTASTGSKIAGSLATPTDAYYTAYDYRQKKDIEGLKRIMSKDILEFFTDMGKSANKTADDMLMDMCNDPQAATAEARNEKIDGDHATVEYLDAKGGWSTMDFEKVGTEWKLSFPKGDKPPAGKDSKPVSNK